MKKELKYSFRLTLPVLAGLPMLVSIAAVVWIHLWKRNTILSISVGTVFYMILIRIV